ncbi:Bug family tripartite tricarboxylate transporter substrate binding protein [Paracraurococcus ruber]|nr:tripartite tricarboxylate transporter substrate binding protein [Paracraurococcus ruber]
MLRRAMLAATLLLPWPAAAQDAPFPSRPITLLVGFAPGGGTDILARLIAPKLSEELGQPVAVENRTGGGGTIAVVATTRARPDGHTVTLGTLSNNAQVPLAMKAPPFDPLRDVTPLVQVASVPLVMTVPATSPARDVQGFVALAKAAPGTLNFASNGVGTSQHMAAELFMLATGTRMVHVPYRGSGPASIDLAANVVQVNFDTLSTVLPHIRGDRLRGLAVTTRARSDQLPEVPTMIESGIAGYDIDLWYMLFGPAALPEAVTARWAEALNKALADRAFRQRLVEAGFGPAGGTPAQAAAVLRADITRYGEVIRRAGITLE